MQHMGAKAIKPLFYNGFHTVNLMWQKGGRRGQKPLILSEAATEEAVFCFNFASILLPCFFRCRSQKSPSFVRKGGFLYAFVRGLGALVYACFCPFLKGCTQMHPPLIFACICVRFA